MENSSDLAVFGSRFQECRKVASHTKLPENPLELHNFKISEIELKIVEFKDIATSAYSQKQKKEQRQITFAEEEEIATHGKRMLRLTLTDGHEIIYALEVSPISSLNDLRVSQSVLLKNCLVRRGMILLESAQNVTLIRSDDSEVIELL
jgi:hypothetical protein